MVLPADSNFSRALSSKRSTALAMGVILLGRFGLCHARAGGYVVHQHAEKTEEREGAEHWFKQPLPHRVAPRDLRIFRQVAITLWIGSVVKYIDYVRPADRLWIVNS